MKTQKSKRSSEVPPDLELLMEVVRPHFLVKGPEEIDNRAAKFGSTYPSEWSKIQSCIAALLQLDSAFEDCFIAKKLVGKVRTSQLGPKPSSYLRFCWLGFLQSIYIYCEKLKLVSDAFVAQENRKSKDSNSIDFVSKIKIADKLFKNLKKLRGGTVHNWHVEHKHINFVAMLELLHDGPHDPTLPIGFYNLEGHLVDVKRDIKTELSEWEKKLQDFHVPLRVEASGILVEQVKKFNSKYQ